MGSIYDQQQTEGISQLVKEAKSTTRLTKWILWISLATFIISMVVLLRK